MRISPALRAYLIILLSTSLLLMLQWAYPLIPGWSNHFKNTRFITYYLNESESADTSNHIDSTLLAQLDTSMQDINAGDSLLPPPLNQVDEAIFESDSFVVPLSANTEHLTAFFRALKSKKKKRIGWWGDSMIEGDLITQTVRREFQKQFGGRGVGFVPMVSYTAGFRQTIVHSFSGWRYYSLVKNPGKKAAFGISGEYMLSGADSLGTWGRALFSTPKGFDGKLQEMYVFTGAGKGQVRLAFNQGKDSLFRLNDSSGFQAIHWQADSAIRSLRLSAAPGNLPFYGISLESREGLILDNFSLRGNSGMGMNKIPLQVLRGFDRELGYDLIVLQFGSNVVSATTKNYDWYEKAMLRVIRHYQTAFPKSSILILGVADKGYKHNGEMISDPGIQRVLKLQYKIALQTGVTFYNLYEAMGGNGSMVDWAEGKPSLANLDYTHFNHRGAEKIGGIITQFLFEQYRTFEKTTPTP